jgi:hypothetical protein
MRAIDTGPLRRARELEALGYLHMAVQDALGSGYGSAVKLISYATSSRARIGLFRDRAVRLSRRTTLGG